MSDERQYGYPDEDYAEYAASNASQEGRMDEHGHLQSKDMNGVERRILDVSLPVGITLATLQKEYPNGYKFEIPYDIKKTMRSVTVLQNRTHADEDAYTGDLGKVLPLSVRVISERSNAPMDIAVDIPGVVPTTLTGNDRHAWVIDSGIGNTVRINEDIFVPDNMFTKHMYQQSSKCDMNKLNKECRMDVDPHKKVAHMETKGVAWKVLMDNVAEGHFADAEDAIYQMNEPIFNSHDSEYSHVAKVPYEVAKVVYEAIAGGIREIERSYVDLNNFAITLKPASGLAWDHTEHLVGDSYGFDEVSKGYEKTAELQKPINAKVKLALEYVVAGQE